MSAPAGWYPDPSDSTRRRWWDGTQWTAQSAVAPGGYAPMPPVAYSSSPAAGPVAVETNTVWIWLAILASTLPIISLFLLDSSGFMAAVINAERNPAGVADSSLALSMQSITISILNWAFIGLAILFCWLDWRELRGRGVPAPFHWGWAFFALLSGGIAVYMIGRAVVLRRRTVAGGWPPLWVWIGVTVLTTVVAIVWVFAFIETMFTQLGHLAA